MKGNHASAGELSLRVLVLAPTGKDAPLTAKVLRNEGIDAVVCADPRELMLQVDDGTGALLITEESIAQGGLGTLTSLVSNQPPWSDLPVLLITRSGADSPTVASAIETLGNVTLLERPLRITALLSAVRTALRARQRQYQIRTHLIRQQRSEQALRDLDRRKDEFLATLSHELRNPLAPLSNSLHVLKLHKSDDPGVTRATAIIERQVNHLERLVDDLLEVSRITRGKIELRREIVSLKDVVFDALETSKPLIDAAEHHLELDLPDETIWVHADPVRLTQVFTNLLNNAAKYADKGARITITCRLDGQNASVGVRDDGIGISPEMLQHVFEMFTQADRSLRRAQGGLGIGLTLVRALVEMHGGRVEARSEGLGKGSEFIVNLPVSRVDRPNSLSALQQNSLWNLRGLRTLVVDDNVDSAESIAYLLTAIGARVAVVHDGLSALDKADDFLPEVVLLDIGMPGMDGYSVARRLRRNPRLDGIKLIAVTGWGQDDDRRRSQDAGFDHHLTKPVDLKTLRNILDPLVGQNPGTITANAVADR